MGGGTRHYDFAKALIRRGHHVTIVASSFHYATFKEMKTYGNSPYLHETLDGVDFIWIRTRPYRGNGVGRVLNQLDYMRKALHVTPKNTPDIIIGSSVHLLAVFASWRVARRLNVPFVMEIRDIWPQTLIDIGMSKWHPYIMLLSYLEKFLYQKAKKIISLLPYAYEHLHKFGIKDDRILWLPNGVSLERSISITPRQFIPQEHTHILYAGAIGVANDIDILIQSAKALQNHQEIHFHIIGAGSEKTRLQKIAPHNVTFYDPMPKENAIAAMKGADLLFFPLADSPVFKFGISSNKLFDYLSSKKPIIFASNAKNNPVKDSGSGVSIPAHNADAITKAILELHNMDLNIKKEMGNKGFAYIQTHHNIENLAKKLEQELISLLYNKQ